MNRQELIRELEFLQDLGFQSLILEEGAAPLPKSVSRPAAAAPAAEPAALREVAPVSKSFATATPPVFRPKARSLMQPAATPAAATDVPAQSPILPLLSKTVASNALFDALGVNPEEDSLSRIAEDIGDCRRCRLCQDRTKIVFGSGNTQARLVFVGEGPGEEEDKSGLPFVGRAGQLLTKMIEGTAEREGIPLKREDVYICNVVKCRPPSNRKPEGDEMEICGQFLFRQLAVIKPVAICVLGATAAQALLNTRQPMRDLRGNWARWRDIPVMVTYHPSYLLRAYNADAKREAWEDLKKVLHHVYDDPANRPR